MKKTLIVLALLAQFLKDWEAGAEVLNPDGTPVPYSEAAVTALTAA